MKTKTVITVSMVILIVMLLGSTISVSPANAAPSLSPNSAASFCQCIKYIQNNKNLPATGDPFYKAYKYGDFLSTYKGSYAPKGYKVTYVTPSTSGFGQLLLIGTAIVFNPGAFYADGKYGHIGYVTNASYNSKTKLWTITYRDANGWTTKDGKVSLVQGLFTESNCTNVAVRKLVTSNLSGVRFFNWSKK